MPEDLLTFFLTGTFLYGTHHGCLLTSLGLWDRHVFLVFIVCSLALAHITNGRYTGRVV
jgi:hypothetical protein